MRSSMSASIDSLASANDPSPRRINEQHAEVIRRIFSLAESTGYTRIAKQLNAEWAVSPRPQQSRPSFVDSSLSVHQTRLISARDETGIRRDLSRIFESSRIVQIGHDDFGGSATYAGNGFEELDSFIFLRQLAKLLLDDFVLRAETRQFAELEVQFSI